jgi:acyl carrier protein
MDEMVTQKVIEIVASQLELDPDKVKPESSFTEDLKADSLAVVELVLALEEAFGIQIPDDQTEKIKTVRDAIDYIRARQG